MTERYVSYVILPLQYSLLKRVAVSNVVSAGQLLIRTILMSQSTKSLEDTNPSSPTTTTTSGFSHVYPVRSLLNGPIKPASRPPFIRRPSSSESILPQSLKDQSSSGPAGGRRRSLSLEEKTGTPSKDDNWTRNRSGKIKKRINTQAPGKLLSYVKPSAFPLE